MAVGLVPQGRNIGRTRVSPFRWSRRDEISVRQLADGQLLTRLGATDYPYCVSTGLTPLPPPAPAHLRKPCLK